MQSAIKWGTIPNFSNYEASTDGDARKRTFIGGDGKIVPSEILPKYLSGSGEQYYYVSMKNDQGETKGCRLNRVIALTHIPNPNNYPYVGHIGDEDKLDNRAHRLEWCTSSKNCRDALKNGKLPGRGPKTPVEVVEAAYTHWLDNGNASATARKFGINIKTMGGITTGRKHKEITSKILENRKGNK